MNYFSDNEHRNFYLRGQNGNFFHIFTGFQTLTPSFFEVCGRFDRTFYGHFLNWIFWIKIKLFIV